MNPTGLVILGFGGHARSVADVAVRAGFTQLVFVDEAAMPGESFAGFAAHSHWPQPSDGWLAFPASGDAERRREMIAAAESRGFGIATLLSSSAYVGLDASVGKGALIAHRAHVGPGARIGVGVIVNTGAIVEHESEIGDYAHIAINAAVAGRCVIGNGATVGAGATVLPNTRICERAVIGAGAVVVGDIAEAGTYVGVPARRRR